MIAFDVKADIAGFKRQLDALERSVLNKVIPRALNRTAANVRTKAVREIAKETGLKTAEAKKATAIVKATPSTLRARVIARGHPRNLIHWVDPQHRRVNAFRWLPGVVVRVGRKLQSHPGSFIGTGPKSNTPLVFRRVGKAAKPIETILGPGLEKTFTEGRLQSVMRAEARTRFIHNMKRELNFVLRVKSQ